MSDPFQTHYMEQGETGHSALLVHDLGASLRDWEELIPTLVTTGHHIYACDLPGHGETPAFANPRQEYAQMYVTAFRQWLDSLALGRAPILIGHGFGAYLCLRYALGHPYKVFRLILLNPLLFAEQINFPRRLLHRYPALLPLAQKYAPAWLEELTLALHPGISPSLAQRLRRNPPRLSPVPFTIADLTPELPRLPTRSLILWGESDPLQDFSMLPGILAPLPEITPVSFPHIGHRPHIEAPEQTNRIIAKFLLGF
jgi:pimeloyl-ACP methyl ester carboxylesterase